MASSFRFSIGLTGAGLAGAGLPGFVSSGLVSVGLALMLAGCNASQPAPQATAATQTGRIPLTPAGFKLPEGSGCAGEAARYRAVMDNDHATGNVNDKVYAQISGEISGAESACSAGKDGEARALLHASKARHGYPG